MIERLPESLRVVLCHALRPVVFPIYEFVERWYRTDSRVRLSRVEATVLWWKLRGPEDTHDSDGTAYPDAEGLLEEIYVLVDRSKPLVENEAK